MTRWNACERRVSVELPPARLPMPIPESLKPRRRCRSSMPKVAELLRSSHTIAVVGLSSKRYRPSYGVAAYMQNAGYRIIPVNPFETEVLGETAYATLGDVPEHIDIVDIFRKSEFVPDLVETAIRVGARAIWM